MLQQAGRVGGNKKLIWEVKGLTTTAVMRAFNYHWV